MALKTLKKLKEINKDYYTLNDLEKITGLTRRSLLVTLTRLQQKGEIRRLIKGIYQLPDQPLDLEKIATQIYQPSYISFETALAKYGILSQIPYTITLATTKKPKKIILADRLIEYRHLKPDLFFGFSQTEGIYLAELEKALLDELYLLSKGKATLPLEELDLKSLDKTKLLRYAKTYPKPTQKLAKRVARSSVNKPAPAYRRPKIANSNL